MSAQANFHAHIAICERCKEQPSGLCGVAETLLREVVGDGPLTCMETRGMIGNRYLRCNLHAVVILQHRGRNEGPYPMCFECGDHNMRNRNAAPLKWLDKALERMTEGRYRKL